MMLFLFIYYYYIFNFVLKDIKNLRFQMTLIYFFFRQNDLHLHINNVHTTLLLL